MRTYRVMSPPLLPLSSPPLRDSADLQFSIDSPFIPSAFARLPPPPLPLIQRCLLALVLVGWTAYNSLIMALISSISARGSS